MSSPSSAGSPEAHANNAEDQPPAPGSEADLDNSFFPSPPAFYKRYTTASLALPPSAPLPAIEGLLACTAAELEPPNPEWIVEGGAYQVFGETWPVEEVLPTLEEMGVTEMFVRGAGASVLFSTGEANTAGRPPNLAPDAPPRTPPLLHLPRRVPSLPPAFSFLATFSTTRWLGATDGSREAG